MKRKGRDKKRNVLLALIFILIFLILVFIAIYFSLGIKPKEKLRFGVIRIEGPIVTHANIPFYKIADSSEIIESIKDAKDLDGIILYINSPGGSASSSFKILDEIKNYKEKNKTVIAFIDEQGLSGAYLIASAADKIYASRMSFVGGIGVIGSYLEIAGLLEKYNISYVRLVKGKYKDVGSPFKHISEEEKELLEKKLDIIYKEFVEEVSKNRNLNVDKIATGEFFTSKEALENSLIDEIGDMEKIKKYLEEKYNRSVEFVEIKRQKSFYEELSRIFALSFYAIGFGFGDSLKNNYLNIQT
jgi:protease-4